MILAQIILGTYEREWHKGWFVFCGDPINSKVCFSTLGNFARKDHQELTSDQSKGLSKRELFIYWLTLKWRVLPNQTKPDYLAARCLKFCGYSSVRRCFSLNIKWSSCKSQYEFTSKWLINSSKNLWEKLYFKTCLHEVLLA